MEVDEMTKPIVQSITEEQLIDLDCCDEYSLRHMHGEVGLLIDSYRALQERLRAAEKDATRYRALRDMKAHSFTIMRDDDHTANYMTAEEWINDMPDMFSDTPDDEIQRMKDANTIWGMAVYPRTPVCFEINYAASLDTLVDRIEEGQP